MPRIKRAVHARKRKNSLLKAAKGYRGGRSRLLRTVKDAVDRSREYSYIGRKLRKRDFRRLWIVRIGAALKEHGLSYSRFIFGLKRADLSLDRKTLSYMASAHPESFSSVVDKVKLALA